MSESPTLPPALPDFAYIKRAWDPELQMPVARLSPGQLYVTMHEESIFTVLGSCVSACIRDVENGVGGMNHFMLPIDQSRGQSAWQRSAVDSPGRFGDVAMARLIESIIKAGGQRRHLEAKLFGGGKVLDLSLDVGARNSEFARAFVREHRLPLSGSDLGGTVARKIYYSPRSGVVRVKHLTAHSARHEFERSQLDPAIDDAGHLNAVRIY